MYSFFIFHYPDKRVFHCFLFISLSKLSINFCKVFHNREHFLVIQPFIICYECKGERPLYLNYIVIFHTILP
nr:MAG TPA: hypothetical protein [Caudoviricetes sp.]